MDTLGMALVCLEMRVYVGDAVALAVQGALPGRGGAGLDQETEDRIPGAPAPWGATGRGGSEENGDGDLEG